MTGVTTAQLARGYGGRASGLTIDLTPAHTSLRNAAKLSNTPSFPTCTHPSRSVSVRVAGGGACSVAWNMFVPNLIFACLKKSWYLAWLVESTMVRLSPGALCTPCVLRRMTFGGPGPSSLQFQCAPPASKPTASKSASAEAASSAWQNETVNSAALWQPIEAMHYASWSSESSGASWCSTS
jgi:hypothetical protein